MRRLSFAKYSNAWFRDDEIASAEHLFEGYVDSVSTLHPSATDVYMVLDVSRMTGDGVHPDSTYRTLVVPGLHLEVTTPTPGSPDPTTYLIDGYYQFWLVRGDAAGAAGHLDPGQPADAAHWYIYLWEDQSQPLAGPTEPSSVSGSTGRIGSPQFSWGRLKDAYRK